MKNTMNFLVGICVYFLSIASTQGTELEALNGDKELFDLLQRIIPLDEYRVNYPIMVRIFSDPGEFECEYNNTADICRKKKLLFILNEPDVIDISMGFSSVSAYEWRITSSDYSNGIVKITAKKRLFSKSLNDWYFEDVDFLFDAFSGKPID